MGKASRRKKAVKEIERGGKSESLQKKHARETGPSRYLLAASIALITFIVYLTALSNGFVSWDDGTYVYSNAHIRSFDLTFLSWAFSDFYASNWHPLTWISHALDYAMWGLKPRGHHLTNIILHAVNAFILMFLVIRLLERGKVTTESGEHQFFLSERTIMVTAGVTGLLFGLHPLHVESVAWVAERKDLICAFFYLLSIKAYVKSEGRGISEKIPERSTPRLFNVRHLLSLCFFILALLAKPMAVTLPYVLLILDWYPLKKIQSLRTLGVAVLEKMPFIALSIVSSVLTVLAQQTGKAFQLMEVVPLSTRIIVAAKSLMVYLGKVIFPFHLVPFYPYPESFSPTPADYLLAGFPAIAVTVVCAALARKQKLWLAVWGCYVITLLPVLGIVQVGRQAMADRYMYLPGVGPFLVLGLASAWVWEKLSAPASWRPVAKFLAAVSTVFVFGSLSLLTVKLIGIWKNDIDLWSYVIEKEPKAYLAYYIRSFSLKGTGQLDEAMADADKAIALNPSYWPSYENRADIFEKKGLFDKALADYDKAIALNPSKAELYYNRGALFERTGQQDKAAADYDKVVAVNPQHYQAQFKRGLLSVKKGAHGEALSYFSRSIDANPVYEKAYAERGKIYLSSGKRELALSDFREACRSGNADGCNSLFNLEGAIVDVTNALFKGRNTAKLVLMEFSDYQ